MMNGHMCWTITSYDYVISAEDAVKENRWKISVTAKTLTTQSFVP